MATSIINEALKIPDEVEVLFDKAQTFGTDLINLEGLADHFPNIDATSFVCETMYGNYRDLNRQLKNVISGPLRVIGKMEAEYNKLLMMLGAYESSLLGMLKSVDPPNLNIRDLFNSFSNMYSNCPFFASTGALDGMMQTLHDIKTLTDMTDPSFKNMLIDKGMKQLIEAVTGTSANSFTGALDSIVSDKVGRVSDLRRIYINMLQSTGVLGLLEQLNMIEDCLESICQLGKSFERTYDRYKKELGIPDNPDDPIDPLNINKMKDRFGGRWDDVKENHERLQEYGREWTSSIDKITDPEFIGISDFTPENFAKELATFELPGIIKV